MDFEIFNWISYNLHVTEDQLFAHHHQILCTLTVPLQLGLEIDRFGFGDAEIINDLIGDPCACCMFLKWCHGGWCCLFARLYNIILCRCRYSNGFGQLGAEKHGAINPKLMRNNRTRFHIERFSTIMCCCDWYLLNATALFVVVH